MPREPRRPPPPLDQAALERLALRYVERFATTRAKLLDYLRRKLRERGVEGAVDPVALADRMVELRYIDDRAYAEGKAAAMARRGLGPRRVRDALRHAGVAGEDAETLDEDIAAGALAAALAFARRRRIGPFAAAAAERDQRERQVAAMVRGGHAPALARRIATMEPGEGVDSLDDYA